MLTNVFPLSAKILSSKKSVNIDNKKCFLISKLAYSTFLKVNVTLKTGKMDVENFALPLEKIHFKIDQNKLFFLIIITS